MTILRRIEGITLEGQALYVAEKATRHSSVWKDGEFHYTSYHEVVITEDRREVA